MLETASNRIISRVRMARRMKKPTGKSPGVGGCRSVPGASGANSASVIRKSGPGVKPARISGQDAQRAQTPGLYQLPACWRGLLHRLGFRTKSTSRCFADRRLGSWTIVVSRRAHRAGRPLRFRSQRRSPGIFGTDAGRMAQVTSRRTAGTSVKWVRAWSSAGLFRRSPHAPTRSAWRGRLSVRSSPAV